jgi:hypothetical protein
MRALRERWREAYEYHLSLPLRDQFVREAIALGLAVLAVYTVVTVAIVAAVLL